MLPFGVTIPATVPQRSEIPEGLMNYTVCCHLEIVEDRLINNVCGNVLLVNLDLVPIISLKGRNRWQGLVATSPV